MQQVQLINLDKLQVELKQSGKVTPKTSNELLDDKIDVELNRLNLNGTSSNNGQQEPVRNGKETPLQVAETANKAYLKRISKLESENAAYRQALSEINH